MGERLYGRHGEPGHLVSEGDLDPVSLDPETKPSRVRVKVQLGQLLDDLDALELLLAEHPLARASWPVENELPERAPSDPHQGYHVSRARKTNPGFGPEPI